MQTAGGPQAVPKPTAPKSDTRKMGGPKKPRRVWTDAERMGKIDKRIARHVQEADRLRAQKRDYVLEMKNKAAELLERAKEAEAGQGVQ
jgi:hypothetical protein